MTIIPIYRYIREDGGVTVSPDKPQGECTEIVRIIADEDKLITKDGVNMFSCIDTDNADGWQEVEYSDKSLSHIV